MYIILWQRLVLGGGGGGGGTHNVTLEVMYILPQVTSTTASSYGRMFVRALYIFCGACNFVLRDP